MKKAKATREWHTAPTKYGMGDYYGTGIKQPVARIREDYMMPQMSSKKIGKPPKALA
jgi:hypothetical protein